jgi:hypothetical protein
MLYIGNPSIQKISALAPTNKINPGATLPDIRVIGPADPTPYTCTKNPDTGKGSCVSDKGNVLDALALLDDAKDHCSGMTVCTKDSCSCTMK